MVKLNFDARGYWFQEGLKVLRSSFNSAVEALELDVEGAKSQAAQYSASVDAGGEWIGERDEDGHVLWDQESVLRMRLETCEEALMALRKAFVISAYHHWERWIRAWTGSGHSADHDKLVRRAIERGLSMHEKLDAVRSLTNVLKHNKSTSGENLWATWSDLFPPDFRPTQRATDWYNAVHLRNCHVLEILEVAARSGPTAIFP
ncbi:UNVERIFIED_ORG: hypothetical protein J2740_001116 [Rhizobium nepotum]|nr:hypothetical protein [Rhizobium nepotum]